MNRQTIRTPRICTAGALPETAWPKVATIIIINSTPSEKISEIQMTCGEGERLTHPLTTDYICQPTKEDLTDESTDGGCDFDSQVLVLVQLLAFTIDIAQHG
jgi:hypothetical protein